MSQRSRKFLGVFLLLGSMFLWAGAASALYTSIMQSMPMPVLLVYFAIAGLGWTLPAAVIIKWMSRPDVDNARTE